MTDVTTSTDGAMAFFDGMTWPVPSFLLGYVEHALRHGTATAQEMQLAASVMRAYRQMVNDPRTKREHVIRTLRKVMK